MAKRPVKPRRTRAVQPVDDANAAAGAAVASGASETSDAELSPEDRKVQARREFLQLARKRFQSIKNAESKMRADMLDDFEYYEADGKQWPAEIRAQREEQGLPCLEINRLPTFVRQVTNQQREARPSGQIGPVDGGADVETAEVLQGLIRHIEQISDADVAYETAGEHQAIAGRGWWYLLAEPVDEDSFDQEIKIRQVPDAFSAWIDAAHIEPDGSDARFGFLVEAVPEEEWDVRWPNEPKVTAADFADLGADGADWAPEGKILVANYYYIEEQKYRIALVQMPPTPEPVTGQPKPGPVLTVERKLITPEMQAQGIKILKERDTFRRQLKFAKITGVSVLDGNADRTAGRDLPGKYVPIIPVLGERLVVNGRRNLRGMVRDAKSQNSSYNFWWTAATEKMALAPKAPYIMAEGQDEGYEDDWANANLLRLSRMIYRPVTVDGHLAPPPERNDYDPQMQGVFAMLQQADRNLKETLGMFDASQERSPEQSGKAILARQRQGEIGNSHFMGNLARSIKHTVKILLDWIPVYYDVPRVLRIIGQDNQPKDVMIHAGNQDAAEAMHADESIAAVVDGRIYDIGVGRYDVTISMGPSFQTKRQEAVESMIQLLQAYPQAFPLVADLLTKNMDWPFAQELSRRLESLVPPSAKGDPASQVPPEVQQQLDQLSQQLKDAMAALQQRDAIINAKAQELAAKGQIAAMEAQSRERIALLKEQGDLMRIEAQLRADQAMALVQGRLDAIQQMLAQAPQGLPDIPVGQPPALPPAPNQGPPPMAAG